MTKKWLMYVVTGLLCCGLIGLAVAKQNATQKMTSRDRAKLELQSVRDDMAKSGQTPELLARESALSAQLKSNVAATAKSNVSIDASTSNVAPAGTAVKSPANVAQTVAQKSPEKIEAEYRENLVQRWLSGEQLGMDEKALIEEIYNNNSNQARPEVNPLDNQGGPNTFGYRWVDNLAGDTATFAWENPTAPVELTTISSSDDAAESLPFGFSFNFYGTSYTSGWASTNGVLCFDASQTTYWINACPLAAFTNPALMVFNDDGHNTTGPSSDGGRVVYQQYADHVTITWDSLGTCCTNGTDLLEYQVQLWNNGKIKYQYRQIQKLSGTSSNGASPIIGIQNPLQTDPLTYYCNSVGDTAYTNNLDGRAIWFYLGTADAHNFACNSVVSPNPLRVEPNTNFNVVARFTNLGSTTESSPVKYRFNGGPLVTENTAVLAQFGTEDHDWAGTVTAPGTVGDYELLIYSDLPGDANRTNDTCRVTLQVRTCSDQAVTAPGSWSNTTVGDDCNLRLGADYNYQITIPHDGNWTFTLCNGGSTWDTYLYLTSSCCGTILFSNDDYCGLQSQLNCVTLTAGDYWLDVEPFSSGGAGGAFTLDVYECVLGACCYGAGLCTEVPAVDCANLGGTYQGDGTSCAEVVCPNPCELDCGPQDIIEVAEFNVCNHDTFDATGGCNNANGIPLFQDIQCGDTVCGLSFYYNNCQASAYRDTDWFRIQLTEFSDVTWSAIAEFDGLLVFIIQGPCPGTILAQLGTFDAPCGTVYSTTATQLAPGEYYLWIGPWGSTTFDFAADRHYRAWVDCVPSTAPTGRCCYDAGMSCGNLTLEDCDAVGGTWDEFLTCELDPCPIPVDNDECVTAEEIVVVPNGSVTVLSGASGATPTCADVCDFTSSGPDQFYYFTLTECRLIAIMTDDPNCDSHISLYPDGECCITAFDCNDDYGNHPNLDLYTWLPPTTRPLNGLASMMADTLPAGTYYIRAGHYSTAWQGEYDLTVFDFGPCANAPCDPIIDLAAYVVTAADQGVNAQLHFTAPQDGDYKVWSSTNPSNDGNPDDGADPDFVLEETLLGLVAGPQVWNALNGFVTVKFYIVTGVCEAVQAPTGRCCYDNGLSCADVTEAACGDLGGDWTPFQSCANNPCPPPAPVNDDCSGALEVLNGTPENGSNVAAVIGADITSCTSTDVYDVWYYFVATTTDPIWVTLCDVNTDFDTGLAVFDACGGTELACNDDDFLTPPNSSCDVNFVASTLEFTPAAAGTYYIRVAGWNSNTGNFVLTVTQ